MLHLVFLNACSCPTMVELEMSNQLLLNFSSSQSSLFCKAWHVSVLVFPFAGRTRRWWEDRGASWTTWRQSKLWAIWLHDLKKLPGSSLTLDLFADMWNVICGSLEAKKREEESLCTFSDTPTLQADCTDSQIVWWKDFVEIMRKQP